MRKFLSVVKTWQLSFNSATRTRHASARLIGWPAYLRRRFKISARLSVPGSKGMAPVDARGHSQETSAPHLQSGPLPAPVPLRARAVSNCPGQPSFKVSVWVCLRWRANHHPAEGFRRHTSRSPAPQVHRPLACHRHDGFLLGGLRRLRVAQHRPSFLHQHTVALPHDQVRSLRH